jgi:hypothetical protein
MSHAVLMAALDLDLPTHGVLTASATLAESFGAHRIGVAAGEFALSPILPKVRLPTSSLLSARPTCDRN